MSTKMWVIAFGTAILVILGLVFGVPFVSGALAEAECRNGGGRVVTHTMSGTTWCDVVPDSDMMDWDVDYPLER